MNDPRTTGPRAALALVALLLLAAPAATRPARAESQLITNGGFESGFAGWTRVAQPGSEGAFLLQSGNVSPVNGFVVPAPPGGASAAMTDAEGPGARVLYQDFVVPFASDGWVLGFDLYVGNLAGEFFSPTTLDFATPVLNQQARVDLLLAGADPFSVASSDVLLNLFQTRPGDTFSPNYTSYLSDVSTVLNARVGQTLRLRFAETDNVFIFQFGVDNVSLAVIPEPSSLLLFVLGGLTVGVVVALRRPGRGAAGA